MTQPTSPFQQFLGLVDTALDAVTEIVEASGITAEPGKRENDPIARAVRGASLIFGDFAPPAPRAKTTPAGPAGTWAAATDDPTAPTTENPARASSATRTPSRLVELENLRTFCEQAATMLSAGVAPPTVFFLIANDVSAAAPEFAEDVAAIGSAIRQGRSIADTMFDRDVFPSMLVEMVRAGEIGGHLTQTLRMAGAYFRDEIDYLNGHPRQPIAGDRR